MNAESLKNSILQLAIQGKLVEQREEEGTGIELFEKIKNEKEEMIKLKLIRKEKTFPKIEREEIPYEIPENWVWVRFGDLGSYRKGPFGSALKKSLFVPKGKNTIKVYEQKNAINKDVNIGDYYITQEYFEEKMKNFELSTGDIIVSCAGTIGETYVMPEQFERGIINQALMQMKLMPSLNGDYFLVYFDFILKKTAREKSKGSAIKNIPPFAELKNYLVPIPPLAEQKRIVEKIEELMPLVERYSKAYEEVTELNKDFPVEMEKSILQYAIQGKLVEQREDEGTAEELYKQIQLEKEKLIEEGKIRKQKKLPGITEEEIPFEIPETWKWVRLGDVFTILMGQSPKGKNVSEEIQGIEFHQGKKLFGEKYLLKSPQYSDLPTRVVEPNTLIMSVRAPVGDVNITEREICIGRGLCGVQIINNNTKIDFLYYLLTAIKFEFIKKSTGSTFSAITAKVVHNQVIPLPPLAEQKRIVARIEELLEYTRKLKEE